MENDLVFEELSPEEQLDKIQYVLEQINKIETMIQEYQVSGFDVSELEARLKEYEDFFKEHFDYIVSVQGDETIDDEDLEKLIEKYELEEQSKEHKEDEADLDELDKENKDKKDEQLDEIEETTEDAGLDKEDTKKYIKKDSSGNLSLDSKAFEQSGIKSNDIDGNKKVTSNHSFNDVVGMHYASYKIIKTISGYPVVIGITEDGTAEKVPDNKLEIDQSQNTTMTLIRSDGSIKEVGLVASFRVKDAGSSIGRDQAIGLYNDNGNVNGFYARNALGNRMLGEELPCNNQTYHRTRTENLMDTSRNQNISAEADSAMHRTDDGCNDRLENLGNGENTNMMAQKDSDELAEEYAKKYDIDVDELKDRFNEELESSHSRNISDEELMEEVAEEIDREERHEPPEPGERTLGHF